MAQSPSAINSQTGAAGNDTLEGLGGADTSPAVPASSPTR
jgi:hypothetical protein